LFSQYLFSSLCLYFFLFSSFILFLPLFNLLLLLLIFSLHSLSLSLSTH
jgi:hypothetical protein